MNRNNLVLAGRVCLVLALAAAYVVALAASWRHLAATFGTLEAASDQWAGVLAATAVDLGLAALALAVAHESRRGRGTRGLWLAVAFFAAISTLANADHALTAIIGHTPTRGDLAGLDALVIIRVLVFAATLPAMVLVLAWVVDVVTSGEPATAVLPAPAPQPAPAPSVTTAAQRAPREPATMSVGGGKTDNGTLSATARAMMAQGVPRSTAYKRAREAVGG